MLGIPEIKQVPTNPEVTKVLGTTYVTLVPKSLGVLQATKTPLETPY